MLRLGLEQSLFSYPAFYFYCLGLAMSMCGKWKVLKARAEKTLVAPPCTRNALHERPALFDSQTNF